jgi:hypothetical protein
MIKTIVLSMCLAISALSLNAAVQCCGCVLRSATKQAERALSVSGSKSASVPV